jgi:hypothetical protein
MEKSLVPADVEGKSGNNPKRKAEEATFLQRWRALQ